MPRIADRLIRSSVVRVIHLAATVAIGFFMMPFMIRSMGDRWYGLWVFVGSLIGYYGLLDIGLTSAIHRFISRALATDNRTEANDIFNTSLALFSGAGVISAVASLLIALFAFVVIDDPTDLHVFRTVMILCGLSAMFSFPMRAFQGFLGAHIRQDFTMSIGLAEMGLRTFCIVYFFRRGHGIVSLAVITLATSMLANLAIIAFVRTRYPYVKIGLSFFKRNKIRELLHYSIFSFISDIANQLRFQIDNLVISAFLGLSSVTVYSIGSRISLFYLGLITRPMALMTPVFSALEGRSDYEKIRDRFLFACKLNAILAVYGAGTILIYGKAFLLRWMGSAYLASFSVLVILIAGSFFNALQITSTSLIFSLSKHRPYALVNLGEGVVNLVLSIVLVKRYGIYGVALGTVIPMVAVYLFFVPLYANRIIDMPVSRYAKIMLGAVLLGAAVHAASWLAVRNLIAESYGRILLLAGLTTVVYVTVTGFLLLSRSEREYFKVPL